MSLNINEPPVENQLPQAIRKMRDFLLTRPTDKEYYKTLYDSIDNLVVKAITEGWFGYQHKNNSLLIPKLTTGKFNLKRFHWIVNSLSHESLHEILNKEIGLKESYLLDNLKYHNICNGCIHNQTDKIWKCNLHPFP